MPAIVNLAPGDTLSAAVRRLSAIFSEAGIDTPEIDARFLVQGVLQLGAAELFRNPDRTLGSYAPPLQQAAVRRLAREPVSRILGRRDFYGREFLITPDVLDPRSDTEALIETVLEIAERKSWHERRVHFADIGVGSGSILVTLLAELPGATGLGIDVSRSAIDVARLNAERHGVAERAQFVCGVGLAGARGPFDLIVSNPPYIPSGEIADLAPEVRNFDPRLALDGGTDGLQVYRQIAMEISAVPAPLVLVVELGAGQEEAVTGILLAEGRSRKMEALKSVRDLGGHVRCVALEIQ